MILTLILQNDYCMMLNFSNILTINFMVIMRQIPKQLISLKPCWPLHFNLVRITNLLQWDLQCKEEHNNYLGCFHPYHEKPKKEWKSPLSEILPRLVPLCHVHPRFSCLQQVIRETTDVFHGPLKTSAPLSIK